MPDIETILRDWEFADKDTPELEAVERTARNLARILAQATEPIEEPTLDYIFEKLNEAYFERTLLRLMLEGKVRAHKDRGKWMLGKARAF